jgi:hypothetical protein
MGLDVRIVDLQIDQQFKIDYKKSGTTQYINVGTYPASTNIVVISNLDFNTSYDIRLTILSSGQETFTTVLTNDSKCFDCYDQIDFYIDVGNESCTGKTVTLYDLISGQTGYGNSSSVINGTPKSYRIYTGLTNVISASTFVTTATTNPSTGEIYQFENFKPTHIPVFIFLEHGDGSIQNETNTDPLRQGGFQVRSTFIGCGICFTYRCNSGGELSRTILYPTDNIFNDRPVYSLCCFLAVYFNQNENRWEFGDGGEVISILNHNGPYPLPSPPTIVWSGVTGNAYGDDVQVFTSRLESCPPACDITCTIDEPYFT